MKKCGVIWKRGFLIIQSMAVALIVAPVAQIFCQSQQRKYCESNYTSKSIKLKNKFAIIPRQNRCSILFVRLETMWKRDVLYQVRPAICRDFQCDKPRNKILADKRMYHEENRPVDMRAEFYGKPSVFEALHQGLMDALGTIT